MTSEDRLDESEKTAQATDVGDVDAPLDITEYRPKVRQDRVWELSELDLGALQLTSTSKNRVQTVCDNHRMDR